MTLILIRGMNASRIVTSIKILELQANMVLQSKPVVINPNFADTVVETILNSKVKRKSKKAVAFHVKNSYSSCISKIKKVHLKAHAIIINEDFEGYSQLEYMINTGEDLKQYEPCRFVNEGMIDYSINKDNRQIIKNSKINSYKR